MSYANQTTLCARSGIPQPHRPSTIVVLPKQCLERKPLLRIVDPQAVGCQLSAMLEHTATPHSNLHNSTKPDLKVLSPYILTISSTNRSGTSPALPSRVSIPIHRQNSHANYARIRYMISKAHLSFHALYIARFIARSSYAQHAMTLYTSLIKSDTQTLNPPSPPSHPITAIPRPFPIKATFSS